MAEEEFHEIQLNGKQLVFLFMAGTVAAVVIFLCGLMVGRNLRSPRLEAAAATTELTLADPTRPDQAPLPPATPSTEHNDPVSIKEDLSYGNLVDPPSPAEETLRDEPVPRPAPRPADKPTPADQTRVKAAAAETNAPATKNAAAATGKPVPTANSEPPGNGWAVQVVAVQTRDEADAIARRLSAKQYPTYVTVRGAGRFGVRVGKFPDRRTADDIKAKLEKEEQFKPWVTR